MDYKEAGVDIEAGSHLVQWLKQNQLKGALSHRVVQGIGGFSGLFNVKFPNMKEPCLSASVDGVGTKLKLATHFNKYEEIGQDLVAMCVNDVICSGATPLFFMDYYACGKLRPKLAKAFLTGVKRACEESACVLLGGETAEMPGCYTPPDFDCAGFAVGVVDRANTLGSHMVCVGDRLIAVESLGFHSNGFSLLREVFKRDLSKWERHLTEPTALYAKLALSLFKSKGLKSLKALAHITGGGIDNILRVLPKGMCVRLKPWEVPSIFKEVQKRAGLTDKKLMQTLNCGVGLVALVDPVAFELILEQIRGFGFKGWDLGVVEEAEEPTSSPTWFF